jgi:hypothetical protein
VAERVTIIARHVEGADKEALFASAALFAMSSLSENFGLAAFEAMRTRRAGARHARRRHVGDRSRSEGRCRGRSIAGGNRERIEVAAG